MKFKPTGKQVWQPGKNWQRKSFAKQPHMMLWLPNTSITKLMIRHRKRWLCHTNWSKRCGTVKTAIKKHGSMKTLFRRVFQSAKQNSFTASNFRITTLKMLMRHCGSSANLMNQQRSAWNTWIHAELGAERPLKKLGTVLMKLIRFQSSAASLRWIGKLIWQLRKNCTNYSWKSLLHRHLMMTLMMYWQRRKMSGCWR